MTLGVRLDAALLAAGAGADRRGRVELEAAGQRGGAAGRVGARVRRPARGQARSRSCSTRDWTRVGAKPPTTGTTREESMKIGLFTVVFNDKPLEEVADYAAGLGLRGVRARGLARVEPLRHRPGDTRTRSTRRDVKKMLDGHGIEISALSNHLFSQMVLPFSDARSTSGRARSDKDEMVKLGTRAHHQDGRGRLASSRSRPSCGFFGSTVWESWYIWPPQRLAIYEEGWELFVERWTPILDRFKELGVRFAHEVPPDRDRLQRLHRARGHQAPRTATTGASTSIRATWSGS